MSRLWLKRTIGLLLAVGLLLGCGGSGDKSPTKPPTQEDALAIMAVLDKAFAQLNFTQLLMGGQVIQGVRGTLTLTATVWTFDHYSPDGDLELNGQLTLNVLTSPVPMKGRLELSGSQAGTVVVDMTIDLSTNPQNPTLGGTVTFNGVVFQVAELMQAVAQAQAASG